ncbi:MAG: sulfatase [Planctomycetota bacterium]
MRDHWIPIFGFAMACLAMETRQTPAADKADPPNILFILTDDQGWPTLGCYGSHQVGTPNLDRLAVEGVRLTDAYVMPQCTPTRAALLTGQHTARYGMWHVIGWYGSPWAPVSEPMFREQLEPEACQLPHRLRSAGYATGMAGKWHLTTNQHGHYSHLRATSGDAFGFDSVAPPGAGSQNQGDKWVDHLTDCAIDFIRDNRERPWFYYLSHHTLHGELSAPDALVQKYLDAGAPKIGLHNATYLACIEHLDHSIGRLLNALDELALSDNTLVVFLSDNGGVDSRFHVPESSPHVLAGEQPLVLRDEGFDNAPLRDGKGSVYEGGLRVPCLVRWPAKIPADQAIDAPVHVVDWLPTLASAAGSPVDELTDGHDLLPLLTQPSGLHPLGPPRSLYWYMPLYDLRWASTPCAAIRKDAYKLIWFFGDRFDRSYRYQVGETVELYRLDSDISESQNLAQREPDRAASLKAELKDWIERMGAVIPKPNPHHDASRAFEETRDQSVVTSR